MPIHFNATLSTWWLEKSKENRVSCNLPLHSLQPCEASIYMGGAAAPLSRLLGMFPMSKSKAMEASHARKSSQSRLDRSVRSKIRKYTDPDLKDYHTYNYEPLKDMKRCIRILRLIHADLESSKLECELFQVEFDEKYVPHRLHNGKLTNPPEKVEYKALSWCWGTADPEHAIVLISNGKPTKLAVKRELALALKYLRHPDKDLYLWIDALCIDQRRHTERNHQVQMMAMIYTRASDVCVWLGEDDDNSEMAIRFIREKITHLDRFDELCQDKRNAENWQALLALMQREWFRRRWVVQEIALARKADIYCGPDTIPWRDFAVAVELFVEVETATHRLSEVIQKDDRFYHVPGWFEWVSQLGASLLVSATAKVFRGIEVDSKDCSTPPMLARMGNQPVQELSLVKNDSGKEKEVTVDPLGRRGLLSLEYLVSTLSAFEATQPRDAIYSLLAIAKDTSPFADTNSYRSDRSDDTLVMNTLSSFLQRKPYRVDYGLPYSDVCKDFIYFCITRSQDVDPTRALDIICRPWAIVPKAIDAAKSSTQPEKEPVADDEETSGQQEERRDAKRILRDERPDEAYARKRMTRKPRQSTVPEGKVQVRLYPPAPPSDERPIQEQIEQPREHNHFIRQKKVQTSLREQWELSKSGPSNPPPTQSKRKPAVNGIPPSEGESHQHAEDDNEEGKREKKEEEKGKEKAEEKEEEKEKGTLCSWLWSTRDGRLQKPSIWSEQGNNIYKLDKRPTSKYWEDVKAKLKDTRKAEESKIRKYFPGPWRGYPDDLLDHEPSISREDVDDIALPTWISTTSSASFGTFKFPGIQAQRTGRKNADSLVGLPGGNRSYSAAQTQKAQDIRFCKRPVLGHHSLYVKGFILDRVEEVADPALGGNIPKNWTTVAGWDDIANCPPPDAFVRTLVADRGANNRNPPYYYNKACKESMIKGSIESGRVNVESLIHNEQNSIIAEFCRRVQEVIWNRCMIKTANGRLGLVTEKAKKGDLVCIIYGCSVPVILRRFHKENVGATASEQDACWNKLQKLYVEITNVRGQAGQKERENELTKSLVDLVGQSVPSSTSGQGSVIAQEHHEDRVEALKAFIRRCEYRFVQRARYEELKKFGPDKEKMKEGFTGQGYGEYIKEMTKAVNDYLAEMKLVKEDIDRKETQSKTNFDRIREAVEKTAKRLRQGAGDAGSSSEPSNTAKPEGNISPPLTSKTNASSNSHSPVPEPEAKNRPTSSTTNGTKTPSERERQDWEEDFDDTFYYYEIMGESYVHGMMDGDAIRERFERLIKERVFELR